MRPTYQTMQDVLDQLGGIAASRVRIDINPGKATIKDLIRLNDKHDSLYELVDGYLVEKVVGAAESFVALELARILGNYLELTDAGFLLGSDGSLHILPQLVRLPDLCFISWKQRPERTIPSEPVPELHPELAVEVLGRSNTKREMERKKREYFFSGAKLLWLIDPRKQTIDVYNDPDTVTHLTIHDTLSGGDLLPGFSVAVKKLFHRLEPSKSSKSSRKKK